MRARSMIDDLNAEQRAILFTQSWQHRHFPYLPADIKQFCIEQARLKAKLGCG
jgi:hypothetical protein